MTIEIFQISIVCTIFHLNSLGSEQLQIIEGNKADMAKNSEKSKKHISPNEEKLHAGIELINRHPVFSRLKLYRYSESCGEIQSSKTMSKKTAAYLSSSGTFFLNKDCPLEPEQWAFVIAHNMLHRAFGHFDAQKLPGYERIREDGTSEWVPSFDKLQWNIACDIYIDKFLADIKFGKPIREYSLTDLGMNLNNERAIYEYLMQSGQNLLNCFGTAESGVMDMVGLEHPLVYQAGRRNEYEAQFAYALAASVSDVVGEAGGHRGLSGKKYTKSELAAQWFINHFPLLGSLAASFRIIEDYKLCNEQEISIAAICVEAGEIYVNPAAGLSEEELKFVIAHEFLHAGLEHGSRCKGRDPELWNVACDYVINGWLHEMQVGKMPNRGILYDESLKDISAEALYDEIVNQIKAYKDDETLRGYGKGDVLLSPLPGRAGTGVGVVSPFSAYVSVEEFCKSALRNGLEYQLSTGRGYIPAGLIEEIRALSMPPIPWDVELANWFDAHFAPLEKKRTYSMPSRRQGSTPDIPRPRYVSGDIPENSRTYGVIIDTSGSMSTKLIGYALGAVASFSVAKEVPAARVIFCDAEAYDEGYISPEDISGRVEVKGRGGTVLQPAVDLLERAADFPKDGPILIITDGYIESDLKVKREHAFLVPQGHRLPFRPRGKVFYFE